MKTDYPQHIKDELKRQDGIKNNWQTRFRKLWSSINKENQHLTTERIEDLIEELLAEQKKAYGGCDKCYGKGYATNIDFMSGRGIHYQSPYYLPCDCNRGEQIREMLAKQKKELMEEALARENILKDVHNLELDSISCKSLEEFMKWSNYRKNSKSLKNHD